MSSHVTIGYEKKISHAFSRRPNLIESIVQRFPGTESDDEYVILQSCFFSPL